MIVYGFHGTTEKSASGIIENGFLGNLSKRPRWLGAGVYFFQDGRIHASNWAKTISKIRKQSPVLIMAEIDMTDIIDFSDGGYWDLFRDLVKIADAPKETQLGPEALFREISPAEESVLGWNYEDHYYVDLFYAKVTEQFNAKGVRASFVEGKPLHRNSWLLDGAHTQICIKDPTAIKSISIVSDLD